MKGVLLAGGTGSRLRPLTNIINKHILPVGRYPMIYHPLQTLTCGGITDVLIISGKEHMGTLISQLGSGSKLGLDITYKIQDEADGIAGALKLCKNFVNDEDFAVILGDNIFTNKIKKYLSKGFSLSKATQNEPTCKLFIQPKSKEKLTRFGVPAFDKDGKIINIVEKPEDPPSKYCVTGLYIYDKNIWKIIKDLKKSFRNEYEISDINSWYAQNGNANFSIISNDCWYDAGTPESLLEASNKMKNVIYDEWQPNVI